MKSGAELVSDVSLKTTYYGYPWIYPSGTLRLLMILIMVVGTLCWTHAGPVCLLSQGTGGFSVGGII